MIAIGEEWYSPPYSAESGARVPQRPPAGRTTFCRDPSLCTWVAFRVVGALRYPRAHDVRNAVIGVSRTGTFRRPLARARRDHATRGLFGVSIEALDRYLDDG